MLNNQEIQVDPNSDQAYSADELRSYYALVAQNQLIAAEHSEYLLSDGRVKALGYNDRGKSLLSRLHDIKSIAACSFSTFGLAYDGTVQSMLVEYGDPTLPNISGVKAISSTFDHIVLLKNDGTVEVLNQNGSRQNEIDTSGWRDIVQVSGGRNSFVLGLKKDGKVVAAGKNDCGQCNVDAWTDIVSVAAGHSHALGLRADGTVVAVGDNSSGQCNVSEWRDVIAISGGIRHSVAIVRGRKAIATKYLGDPDFNCGQCDVYKWKSNIIKVVQVSAGATHTFAVDKNGYVWSTPYAPQTRTYASMEMALLTDCRAIEDTLFASYDNLFQERSAKQEEMRKEAERRAQELEKIRIFKSKGVCTNCGGSFKGLLFKKCSVCGKPKDY